MVESAHFQAVVAARKTDVKLWNLAGWHGYSHFIGEDGTYIIPTPEQVRGILLNSPQHRWLQVLSDGRCNERKRGQLSW